MFSGTQNFQQDIGSWKTTNVKDMSYMFYNAVLYNLNFANWSFTKVTSMAGFIGSTSGYNLAKTGAVFVRLSKNSTFSNKRINLPTGSISYLATPTSIAAVSSLTGSKKNVIAVTQVVPVVSSFKTLNYAIADLTTLGYKLTDLLK
jgi:surface protein